TLFPYTTLFRSANLRIVHRQGSFDDVALAPRQREYPLGELPHRELVRVANVGRIGAAVLEQADDALDEIVHIAEGTRLRAVTVHGERLAAQRLHDEVRYDAPIVRTHAGAIGIEDAHDARVEAVIAMIGHRQCFREAL